MLRYRIRVVLLTLGVVAGYAHGVASLQCGSSCGAWAAHRAGDR